MVDWSALEGLGDTVEGWGTKRAWRKCRKLGDTAESEGSCGTLGG